MLERASLAFSGVVAAPTPTTCSTRRRDRDAPKLAAHQRRDLPRTRSSSRASRRCTTKQRSARPRRRAAAGARRSIYQQLRPRRRAAARRPTRRQLRALNSADLDAARPQFQQKLLAARQGRRAGRRRQGEARRARPSRDRRRGRGRQGARAGRQVGAAAPEHDAAARARLADRPRDARGAVRRELDPRRAGRRQRHARASISEIAQLRAQKAAAARLPDLGRLRRSYDQMAKTPATALGFMTQLVPADGRRAAPRGGRIRRRTINATGGDFQLKPWDWDFYSEQVRKAKLRPRPGRAEALFRDQQGADRRRLLRRQPALRR